MFKHLLINTLVFFISFNCFAQNDLNQYDGKEKRHGIWKGYHEKSKRLRYEGNFEHGVERGVFKYYDDTKAATVIATRDFSANDGSCYVIFYDQKSNKVSEGKLVNKKPEGLWKYYHFESKQLMNEENYSNGVLNGTKKVYYKDGSIAEEAIYLKGKLNGIYKKYAENETILEAINYKKGLLDGEALYYDGKGNLFQKGQYKNDRKWGYWYTYENGKVVKTEKVSKETRNTFQISKTEDGKLIPTEVKPKNEQK